MDELVKIDDNYEFRLEKFKKLDQSPANVLAAETALHLLRRGYTRHLINPWDSRVVALMDRSQCVSFICYSYTEWSREVNIDLGGTEETFRGLGVYRAIWDRFRAIAKEEYPEALRITSSVHKHNTAAKATMSALGRVSVSEKYEYPL